MSYNSFSGAWGYEFTQDDNSALASIWNSESEAEKIVSELLKAGIIVRHLKSFGWPNYIRISAGLKRENERLIDQLKVIL